MLFCHQTNHFVIYKITIPTHREQNQRGDNGRLTIAATLGLDMTRSAAMRLLATIAIIIMIVMTPATVCYSSSSTADPSRVKGNVVVDDIANGWIVHVASKHGANNNNPNNNSDSEATAYTVKCADGFSVNSDSAHVRQHEVHSVAMLLSMISSAATSTRWIPVDGFLNKNLPLCASRDWFSFSFFFCFCSAILILNVQKRRASFSRV